MSPLKTRKSLIKCHRCGKLGHIKKFCRVKLNDIQAQRIADKLQTVVKMKKKVGGYVLWRSPNHLVLKPPLILKMIGLSILVLDIT